MSLSYKVSRYNIAVLYDCTLTFENISRFMMRNGDNFITR